MLSSGLGIIGFSWASSPACTELETIVLQWLGKMSGLHKSLLPFEETKENFIDMKSSTNQNTTNSILTKRLANIDEEGIINKVYTQHTGGGVLLVRFLNIFSG